MGAAKDSDDAEIVIRPFRAGDGEAFRVMNEAWITRHFKLEDADQSTLGDPEGKIIAKGGHVFMVVDGETAIGCCALILLRPSVFEAAKMTVVESYRGRGLGRKLLEYTIAQARALGAKSLYLETNRSLLDAIHLYEAMGFRHLSPDQVTPSPYARANVFMELTL